MRGWSIPALCFVIILLLASRVAAESPPYLVLSPPQVVRDGSPVHAPQRSPAIGVYATPYAYGWFGAAPRRHWSRHFGYYQNYREWSAR